MNCSGCTTDWPTAIAAWLGSRFTGISANLPATTGLTFDAELQGQSTLLSVTDHPVLGALRQQVEHEYRERTPRSRALHAQAQAYLPGGDTRNGTHFQPYP